MIYKLWVEVVIKSTSTASNVPDLIKLSTSTLKFDTPEEAETAFEHLTESSTFEHLCKTSRQVIRLY